MIVSSLGHYRITAALGAGGMGEVWRASDSKLGREVALKVLPAELAADEERLARFEREAKVLASLNHPNIATLYGLESAAWEEGGHTELGGGVPRLRDPADRSARDDGGEAAYSEGHAGREGVPRLRDPADRSARDDVRPVMFLVMELVEGEGLDEVIAKGALPVEEAVAIGVQIAQALEAAHEQGIVHRDLKPANIKIRPDGTVKVLDFGLAKAWETGDADSSAAGVILGTAAYMSPEQARGKAVDRRSDIWSFGVVLWEMLTGSKLFGGETVTDVMAAILTRSPDLDALPAAVPAGVRRLLRRCLERNPTHRLQCLGDARVELLDRGDDRPSVVAVPVAAPKRRALPWIIVAVLGIAVLALAFSSRVRSGAAPSEIRFTLNPPSGMVYHLEGLAPGPVALSPDGRSIAFTLRDREGIIHLGVRRLDAVETRLLEGAEGAQYPFWSPDGTEIGFFTRSGSALRVIPAAGGGVRTLCSARNGKGASWNRDGVIVFTPDSNTPIFAVPAAGGEPRQLTEIDEEAGENSHRHPRFLPDGRRFLYLARNVGGPDVHTVRVGSLDGGTDVEIVRSPAAAELVGDRLLYLRERRLVARDLDLDTLELSGDEDELATDLMIVVGAALGVFTATEDVLVFQQGEEHTLSEMLWLDRSGAIVGRVGDVASYYSIALSPDGSKVAAPVSNPTIGTHDIWITDVERDLRSRVTFDDAEDLSPVWSADGRRVFFSSNRDGPLAVYVMTPGESGEPEEVAGGELDLTVSSESPDGRRLLLTRQSTDTGSDLVVLDRSDQEAGLRPFRVTRFNEENATFSPDGRWVAYDSDESGRFEVYVTPASGDGRRWQVSNDGGVWPRWIASTGELLYQDPAGRFVVVPMGAGESEVRIGAPEVLFGGYVGSRLYQLFDLSPDGARVLYRALSNEDPPDPPIVVVNWRGASVAE